MSQFMEQQYDEEETASIGFSSPIPPRNSNLPSTNARLRHLNDGDGDVLFANQFIVAARGAKTMITICKSCHCRERRYHDEKRCIQCDGLCDQEKNTLACPTCHCSWITGTFADGFFANDDDEPYCCDHLTPARGRHWMRVRKEKLNEETGDDDDTTENDKKNNETLCSTQNKPAAASAPRISAESSSMFKFPRLSTSAPTDSTTAATARSSTASVNECVNDGPATGRLSRALSVVSGFFGSGGGRGSSSSSTH
jgi:hypothetical protein